MDPKKANPKMAGFMLGLNKQSADCAQHIVIIVHPTPMQLHALHAAQRLSGLKSHCA